ncbi:hypothetical protein FACS1894204_00760 [Synergistales bacterium]|nr:hypothetical protein FACS1894204_00760 [Synergistales bacterium]
MRRLFVIAAFFIFCAYQAAFAAQTSAEWEKRIAANTATLWIEGQDLGGIILNARAEINVTRLDRKMADLLDQDREVGEWVTNGLNYYYSNRKDIKSRIKNHEVFVVSCRANKFFEFDTEKLVINGYALQKEDVVTNAIYWESELSPGDEFTIAVLAPALKKGQKIEVSYD